MFDESFSYREDAFMVNAEKNCYKGEAMKEYQTVHELIEDFREEFLDKDFWYCESNFYGIARR